MNNDEDQENKHNQQAITPFESIISKLLNPDEITGKRYFRIDEKVLSKFTKEQIDRNAIHGTLAGSSKIDTYHIYSRDDGVEIAALIEIGDRLCGHPEIVHGGIISAIFDNSFGWLFLASKQKPAFTANLNVNFRKPIYSNTNGVIYANIEKIEVSLIVNTH
jgi:hypothetical protein